MNKRKFQRALSKRCPECGAKLKMFTHIQIQKGVSYSEEYEECDECEYLEKINNKHNRTEQMKDV